MSKAAGEYIIVCENLIKIYKSKDIEVMALSGLDLKVEKGELMAIIGNSGSGKTTLLNMLGGLDKPTMGKIVVDGRDLHKLRGSQLMKHKLETVGFVWQSNSRNLIPYLTAIENVEFPMIISGKLKKTRRAVELLEAVGLENKMHSTIGQLSGGELQRVAISIALANNPKLLIADEPTAALDSRTSDQIMDVFRHINDAYGVTVIIVTHDRQLSRKVDRVVSISDGRVGSEFLRKETVIDGIADSHMEFAVIDRSRRLQLPAEYIDALKLGKESMVKLSISGKDIIISSPKASNNIGSGKEEAGNI